MLNTYIKNRGATKTIVHTNNNNDINEANWDVDYDGSIANISLDLSENGNKDHYDFRLTNDDLANILTIPSINQSLDKRLIQDFKKPESLQNIFLELSPKTTDSLSSLNIDNFMLEPANNQIKSRKSRKSRKNRNIPIQDFLTHISSPKSNEEFVIPFKDNTLLSEQPIYKIIHNPSYNRRKSSTNRKSSSRKSSRKSSSRKSNRKKHHNYPTTRKSPTF